MALHILSTPSTSVGRNSLCHALCWRLSPPVLCLAALRVLGHPQICSVLAQTYSTTQARSYGARPYQHDGTCRARQEHSLLDCRRCQPRPVHGRHGLRVARHHRFRHQAYPGHPLCLNLQRSPLPAILQLVSARKRQRSQYQQDRTTRSALRGIESRRPAKLASHRRLSICTRT